MSELKENNLEETEEKVSNVNDVTQEQKQEEEH